MMLFDGFILFIKYNMHVNIEHRIQNRNFICHCQQNSTLLHCKWCCLRQLRLIFTLPKSVLFGRNFIIYFSFNRPPVDLTASLTLCL